MTARSNGTATYRNRDFFGLVEGLNGVAVPGKTTKTSAA